VITVSTGEVGKDKDGGKGADRRKKKVKDALYALIG